MLFFYSLLIIVSAFVFFIIVPGIGAFAVRGRWRRFRTTLLDSVDFPLYKPGISLKDENTPGQFRCFGNLESVQGNDRLWLQVDGQSVSVDVAKTTIFILPGRDEGYSLDGTLSVQSQRWERAGILTEGIGVFVFGPMSLRDGMPHFSSFENRDIMVIFFEGSPERILSRSLWYGRQRNEYWNEFTPASLLAGTSALMALAFFLFGNTFTLTEAIYASATALIPFLPLMPPGVTAFFLYRRWWRRSRVLRERKDMMALGPRLENSKFIARDSIYRSVVVSKADWDRRRAKIDVVAGERRVSRVTAVYEHEDCLVIPGHSGFDSRRNFSGQATNEAYRFYPAVSGDPMAECVVIAGDPATRIDHDLKRARRFETGALLAMALSVGINWYLILWLIFVVLRSVTFGV